MNLKQLVKTHFAYLALIGLLGGLIVFGRFSDLLAPSRLDLAWLGLLGACPLLVPVKKGRLLALAVSAIVVVYAYVSQLLSLHMLSTVVLTRDVYLLDELWQVSTVATRLLIALNIGVCTTLFVCLLAKRQVVFLAATLVLLFSHNVLGHYGVGKKMLDSPDWKSVSRVCREKGLFSCTWERSNREAIVSDIPGRQEVNRALQMSVGDEFAETAAPAHFRDIYYISTESAFDFFPLWQDHPEVKTLFPPEYPEWVERWGALTAPGFNEEGSFKSRFVSMCGSHYPLPPTGLRDFPCLPQALATNGYQTIVFDEAPPTYDLDILYSAFGFDEVVFLRNRKSGAAFYEYVFDATGRDGNGSDRAPKFVFIFPFTGHHGSGIEPIADYAAPEAAAQFATDLNNREALASSARGIEFAGKFAKKILARDPEALVVFRNDHLFPKTTASLKGGPLATAQTLETLDALPPFLQRFMVVGGRGYERNYPAIIAPQDIPGLLLRLSGINRPKGPEAGLLARLAGSFDYNGIRYLTDYGALYRQQGERVAPVDMNALPVEVEQIFNAKRVLSRDLFYGEQYAYKKP